MVAGFAWLSPTRFTGLTLYSISFLACLHRWETGRRRGGPERAFLLLAGVQLALLLDMAFDWRWKLHEFWMREAIAHGVYDQRYGPQLLALGLLICAVAFGSVWVLHRFRHRVGLALAVMGTLLSVGLWFCEWVSYHAVDTVLYREAGGVMTVGLAWGVAAGITWFGVWLDGRREPTAS